MDSVDVYREQIVFRHADSLVFIIQQNSIRFEKMKKLALYVEGEYMGVYNIVHKHPFKIKNLTDIASLIFLGLRRTDGIKELLKYKIKGRISEHTQMAFICLAWDNYDPLYNVKYKYEKEDNISR